MVKVEIWKVYFFVANSRLINSSPISGVKVRLGEWNMKESTEPLPFEDFEIERREVMIKQFERGEKKNSRLFSIKVHPNYNPSDFQNDIALLKLNRDVVYKEHIIPVCLPNSDETYVGKTATVTGWGRTAHGTYTISSYITITNSVFIL